MASIAKETVLANLEQEMRQSYLDYAMSVIVGRALPDVRDGLKPVHRRVLFAMSALNNDWNKPNKKSARIVGEVIGKFHPHGDVAVYDAIVRMAQPFSLRYMLIDGQGNFGSVDGDSPAAMRYTEIRLARIAHELLADIDKDTVEFGPNYDESEIQPLVLPTRVPNLLVNGVAGIAVGMATNIPPHNLRETVDACVALIDDEDISVGGLMEHLTGPDFPTAGIINGSRGIRDAYETGRGKIYVRARVVFEGDPDSGRRSIVVTELPYQVNKARLMERIAELVKGKRLEGISGLRDESDRAGMRMVIELRRGETPEIVLNNLYQHTKLQTVFGINMVALADKQPRLFSLKELLEEFLRHRREVVTRRTLFDLRKARERAHELEGLAVALTNIDEVIALIRASRNPAEARERLTGRAWPAGPVAQMLARHGADLSRPEDTPPQLGLTEDGYRLSETQAQAILDLRLHRLTGLEQEKLRKEYEDILDAIVDLLEILESTDRLMRVVRDELLEIRERYGDDRRTEIRTAHEDLTTEDLIVEEDMVVTLSHAGYAKSQPVSDYRAQRRGGKGRIATRTRDEDFVSSMFVASTHDTVLCFSNRGKVYWLKVYQLPQAGRQARGRPLVNLLSLEDGEKVTAVLAVRDYTPGQLVVMATTSGIIKKCPLQAFSRPRPSGIRAIDLRDNDELVGVGLTDGQNDILLFSNAGRVVRFSEDDVRPMGRTARGVRGIRLKSSERLISLIVTPPEACAEQTVLTCTERGYGKRTRFKDYPVHRRGGQGVISIQTKGRNGSVVGALWVTDDDEVMLITDGGTLIRTGVTGVSVVGRNTQGVRLIDLHTEERLMGIGKIEEPDAEEPSS